VTAGSGRDGALAMLGVMVGASVTTLDIAIGYTALPAIAAALGTDAATAVWVVNAWQLVMVAAVVPLAALGDTVGHRRVYVAGMALFCAGSVACGLAWSLAALVGARMLQALGAAAVVSVTTAVIRQVYPPHALGRGLGVYAMVVAVSFAVGPTVASIVLSVASWHWLYLMLAPFGALGIALALRALPAAPRAGVRFDLAAALLCAAMFALLVYGIAQAARSAPWAELLLAWGGALACGLLLLRRQRGQPAPMLAIDLLAIPMLALSSATSVLSFVVQGLAFVSLPFLLHRVMGWSQFDTGLLMSTWPAALAVVAMGAGRMSDRWPPATMGGVGLLLLAAGMLLLASLSRQAAAADIAWRLALCAAGFGLFQSPNMNALMSAAPPQRSGGASGIVATSRMLGQSAGAALAAACLAWSEARGPTIALWLGGGFGVLASAVSLLRLRVARHHPRIGGG
jgi:DHA2 family multidrug resistance protein-like MFS transporter